MAVVMASSGEGGGFEDDDGEGGGGEDRVVTVRVAVASGEGVQGHSTLAAARGLARVAAGAGAGEKGGCL